MTETLKLSFSHLFWVRFSKEKIISKFIFELIEHKCGESEKHFISLNLMCENLQRTISLAIRFRFDSFLQRWKALIELHNLTCYVFYHMFWCSCVITAKDKIFLKFKSIFLFETREFTLINFDYSTTRATKTLRELCQVLRILTFFKLFSFHISITTSILFEFQWFLRRWNAFISFHNWRKSWSSVQRDCDVIKCVDILIFKSSTAWLLDRTTLSNKIINYILLCSLNIKKNSWNRYEWNFRFNDQIR